MTIRDFQRSKVYTAENLLYDKIDRLETVAEMQAWVNEIFDNLWFKANFPNYTKSPTVKDGRRRRSASASWGRNTISVPRRLRNKMVILHEIAHLLASGDNHGPMFCTIYLDLVLVFLGTSFARGLRDSFITNGVKYTSGHALNLWLMGKEG